MRAADLRRFSLRIHREETLAAYKLRRVDREQEYGTNTHVRLAEFEGSFAAACEAAEVASIMAMEAVGQGSSPNTTTLFGVPT